MYSEQKKKKNKRKNKETNKQTNKQTKKVEEYINHVILFVEENSRDINNDLFREYFNFSTPIDLTKNYLEDANKNSEFAKEIKNRWSNLKDKTKETSKEQIKNEKPNEILGIINNIIDFHKEVQKQRNQEGQGLKF